MYIANSNVEFMHATTRFDLSTPHILVAHAHACSGRGLGATLVRFVLAYAAARQLDVTIDISDPLPRAQTYYERYGIFTLQIMRHIHSTCTIF